MCVPRSVRGCVCSLSESIRLRLATVRETEPALDTLLQLCTCMGGSFNHDAVQKVWQALVGSDVSLLNHAIQRGVQLRLLKYVTSAGVTSGAGQNARRRSSAASDVGRWYFNHLCGALEAEDVQHAHTPHSLARDGRTGGSARGLCVGGGGGGGGTNRAMLGALQSAGSEPGPCPPSQCKTAWRSCC